MCERPNLNVKAVVKKLLGDVSGLKIARCRRRDWSRYKAIGIAWRTRVWSRAQRIPR